MSGIDLNIEQAYAACRAIARREAKNFYYAFVALPRHKSDAMCAVYAFMRRADDLSDDETMALAERRVAMAAWLAAWRAAREQGTGNREQGIEQKIDPVFIALNDAQRRFGISDDLLEQLVRGTAMDLEVDTAAVQTYATFDELYRYCYLVASVVGLVCIRIFGYSDARAEKLAEETGIAFQLTNILRDVKEDAERGRVYLPLDLMRGHGVSVERVRALAAGAAIEPGERELLRELSAKAWGYYAAAGELLPLIDRDSRAALAVLVEIYSGLLRRIDAREGDVFSARVQVPTKRKVGILLRGMAKSLWNRVAA